MSKFVAYIRVSTKKQGASGLGLEAQQEAIARFIGDGRLLATFTEVESGKNCDRPQLAAAMQKCRATGATLLIAKLDRLARDVHFVAGLMKSDVRFIACDMPHADAFRLHLEAAISEDERRKISERTRVALAAAKARGVVLGGDRGYRFSGGDAKRSLETRQATAASRTAMITPVIEELQADGEMTLREIAAALNERGIPAPRGGVWQATQVARVLAA